MKTTFPMLFLRRNYVPLAVVSEGMLLPGHKTGLGKYLIPFPS